MKYLRFSLIIILFLSIVSLNSQAFNVGIIGGYNENELIYKESLPDSLESEKSSGFSIAVLMEYFEYEFVAFQTGLRFSQTGGILIDNRDPSLEIYAPLKTETNLLYLYIPLTLKLSTKTNPDIYGKASLEGGFLLSAKAKYYYPEGGEREEDISSRISGYNYNGLLGIGASYKIDNVLILVEANWSQGLASINESSDAPVLRTSEMGFNIGVMIDLASGYGTNIFY